MRSGVPVRVVSQPLNAYLNRFHIPRIVFEAVHRYLPDEVRFKQIEELLRDIFVHFFVGFDAVKLLLSERGFGNNRGKKPPEFEREPDSVFL